MFICCFYSVFLDCRCVRIVLEVVDYSWIRRVLISWRLVLNRILSVYDFYLHYRLTRSSNYKYPDTIIVFC